MQRLVAWWVDNPVAANLLMIGLLLSGLLGFIEVEREAFPQVRSNRVQVTVVWPGAAPQEVEEQVVQRIEQALQGVDQVSQVYATASEGLAELDVRTFPGVDINAFVDEVKNAVDAIPALPRDIESPNVRRQPFRQEMLRVALYGDIGERPLGRLAESLRSEMARLPYISTVELFGTRREEVTIALSEEAMRRYGLGFSDVGDAIRASSLNLSSGQLRTATGDVQLRARNLADSELDFARIIIRQTRDGGVIRLGDVARVIDGYEDEDLMATLNGQPAVLLQVQSTDNMQVVKASEAVRAWMEQTRPTLPEGVDLALWFDTADIYSARMSLIGQSALLGLALVFTVLILTLRPRVALWVTAGIGVAFLATFALLPVNDVSLNVISTFAFLLVLGIVVDDAIVVGESVHHASQAGPGGAGAAVEGTVAVARPVIFAVLTTIVAFAPWLFVSGEAAQVTRQLSIVITVALTISLIEAFLILPAHLRHLRPRGVLRGLARKQQVLEQEITRFATVRYRPLLARALHHRYLTASLFMALFAVSLGIFTAGWVKFFFMPEVESEQVFINVELPPGTPYRRSLAILDQLQRAERALIAEVDRSARETGEGSGRVIESWYTRSRTDSVIAIIKLSPPEVRDLSAREVAERLRVLVGEIPDARNIDVNYTLNDSAPTISYLLQHDDPTVLRDAVGAMRAQLAGYDGVLEVTDSQRGGVDELRLQMKPGAERFGLTLSEVSRQVRQAYYGEEVQRLPRAVGDVRVMLRYPREAREDPGSLAEFRVRTATGTEIPLLSIVDLEVARGVQRIQHRDGERVVYVNAGVRKDAMGRILADMKASFLPELGNRFPGLDVLSGGSQEQEEEFIDEITALYTVAFFVMYALIAVAFHSYWLPLLIMTAIPFGFMGAIFGHLLFDTPMALFSYFGIGAATGVVINDNLVLVDFVERSRRAGADVLTALLEAGQQRFRPILLTTVTTVVGLLPIMAERSTDAQFLKPAVLSLAFGVLVALFVTLLLVPALYHIGDDVRHGLLRLRGGERDALLQQ